MSKQGFILAAIGIVLGLFILGASPFLHRRRDPKRHRRPIGQAGSDGD